MIELNIENYPVYMRLGCFKGEQLAGQRVLVSLRLFYEAPEHDSLAETLDYVDIIQVIDETLANHSLQLLETAVSQLGDSCMMHFKPLQQAEVMIEKTVLPDGLNKGARFKMKRTFTRGSRC